MSDETVTARPAWRVVIGEYVGGIWTGRGSARFGGRFNSPGRPAVYAADALSLALLETLARLTLEDRAKVFFAASVELASGTVEDAGPLLPADWRGNTAATRALGDEWLASGRSLALRVPTAALPFEVGEGNLLLNPKHLAFGELKFSEPRPFRIDRRLFRAN